jgi:hypothetical protein
MHRISQTGEEAVDVGVSCIVDNDVGMAVLYEAKMLEVSSHRRRVPLPSYTDLGSLHERHSRS